MAKTIRTLKEGDRVFINSCGALKEYTIVGFRILQEEDGTFVTKVDTTCKGSPYEFTLDLFVKGMKEALDMKISQIWW